jgi:hypothetical protein
MIYSYLIFVTINITGLKLYNKLSSEVMNECKFRDFKDKIIFIVINKSYYNIKEYLNKKCEFDVSNICM